MFGSSKSRAISGRASKRAVSGKAPARSSRALSFETLERREVLSASGFAEGPSVQAKVNVAIRGTSMEVSEMGLPSEMSGNIFNAEGKKAGSHKIGEYKETLTPILMDINGDQIPDFVGTTGVATFTFFVGAAGRGNIGSITTTNVSYIQGVTALGELLVGSQGTIVDGTRALSRVTGSFVSESIVGMGATFSMETFVQFTVKAPLMPGAALLAMVAASDRLSDANAGNHGPQAGDDTGRSDGRETRNESHQRDEQSTDGRLDKAHGKSAPHGRGSQHERTVDQILESETDWTGSKLAGLVGGSSNRSNRR